MMKISEIPHPLIEWTYSEWLWIEATRAVYSRDMPSLAEKITEDIYNALPVSLWSFSWHGSGVWIIESFSWRQVETIEQIIKKNVNEFVFRQNNG